MRIKTAITALISLQLLLVVALIGVAITLHQTQKYAEEAVDRRIYSYQLASELRQSSDDLTRFARTYVTTGVSKYERYFREILAIRNGDIPRPVGYEGVYWDLVAAGIDNNWVDGASKSLRSRMLEIGFTNEEFDKLSLAQNRSDTLVRLEDVAMNAVKGRFDDGTGTFQIEGEPDRRRAIELMHGEIYHQAKGSIMAPIGEFMTMIADRTLAEVASFHSWERRLAIIDIAIACLLLLSTFVSVILLRQRVLAPIEVMASTAKRVSDGDMSARANVSGASEIANFSRTFDHMVDSVSSHLKEVEKGRQKLTSQTLELEEQQSNNERLLLNVLPASIADRLKNGEKKIADSFPEVSVLFSDIVGFTEMSARVGAKQIVDMLNEVFGMLDELANDHAIEKIKTIGDCYMVVAGVPDRSPIHAQQIANFALDAQELLGEYSRKSGRDILMRTGIHTGTVVAGIVGTSKFAYDLWGDVVNIASRMEATSEPGLIQVSDAVHVRLQDDYHFRSRGEIQIKAKKDPMHTWYLTGRDSKALPDQELDDVEGCVDT